MYTTYAARHDGKKQGQTDRQASRAFQAIPAALQSERLSLSLSLSLSLDIFIYLYVFFYKSIGSSYIMQYLGHMCYLLRRFIQWRRVKIDRARINKSPAHLIMLVFFLLSSFFFFMPAYLLPNQAICLHTYSITSADRT